MRHCYEIEVRGRAGSEIALVLADLSPEPRTRSTVLRTPGADQPGLHGALRRLQVLGLEIERVALVEARE